MTENNTIYNIYSIRSYNNDALIFYNTSRRKKLTDILSSYKTRYKRFKNNKDNWLNVFLLLDYGNTYIKIEEQLTNSNDEIVKSLLCDYIAKNECINKLNIDEINKLCNKEAETEKENQLVIYEKPKETKPQPIIKEEPKETKPQPIIKEEPKETKPQPIKLIEEPIDKPIDEPKIDEPLDDNDEYETESNTDSNEDNINNITKIKKFKRVNTLKYSKDKYKKTKKTIKNNSEFN